MKTQHTPGPWSAIWRKDSIYNPNGTWLVDRPNAQLAIAHVSGYKLAGGQLEQEANARLIASAPDLLVALQRAVRQFDFAVMSLDKGYTVSVSGLQECAAEARAAIASATGV